MDLEPRVRNMGTKNKKALALKWGQKGSWFPVPMPLKGYFGSNSRVAEEEQEMIDFAICLNPAVTASLTLAMNMSSYPDQAF